MSNIKTKSEAQTIALSENYSAAVQVDVLTAKYGELD